MKILFLTTLMPYPSNDGGKIKTYNTLSVLGKDNEIDVVCFHEEAISEEQLQKMQAVCSGFFPFEREITASTHKKTTALLCLKSLFVRAPYVMFKYYDKRVKAFLDKQLSNTKYDLIYLDHLQMSIYLPYLLKYKLPIVLDEHNCESVILYRRIEQVHNLLAKAFYHIEYRKLKRFERDSVTTASRVIVLSSEDKKLLEKLCGIVLQDKCYQMPIMVQKQKRKDIGDFNHKKHTNILFLGTLTWEPNNNGMIWFANNILSVLDKEQFDVYIVGKNPSEQLKKLASGYDNVHVEGFVRDVEPYFEKCDYMVVPLFIGSGQRVKIIESFARGFPVIATSIGAEGLEYQNEKNILIADTREAFLEAIQKMNNSEIYCHIAENSYQLYEEFYSEAALQEKIRKSIRLN